MSDSIPLARTASGRLTGSQRKKIVRTLAYPRVSAIYKRTILHWLSSVAIVTGGSPIAIALAAAQAVKVIY